VPLSNTCHSLNTVRFPVAARLDARIWRRLSFYYGNSVLPAQSPRAKARSYELVRGSIRERRVAAVEHVAAFVKTRALR